MKDRPPLFEGQVVWCGGATPEMEEWWMDMEMAELKDLGSGLVETVQQAQSIRILINTI